MYGCIHICPSGSSIYTLKVVEKFDLFEKKKKLFLHIWQVFTAAVIYHEKLEDKICSYRLLLLVLLLLNEEAVLLSLCCSASGIHSGY